MKLMKKFMKKSEGFTLVELIVVIAILAILAGVAIPVYSGYIKKANDAAVITELDAILTAANAANAVNGNVVTIVVNGSTIKVAGEGNKLAGDFNDDFCLFYNATHEDTLGVLTATVDLAGTSYEDGAYWTEANGKWEAGTTTVNEQTSGSSTSTPVTPPCAHATYSTDWTYDDDNHWHVCASCGESKSNLGAHTYENGVCTSCNKTQPVTCTHSVYSTDWTYDDDNHWHVCASCGQSKSNLGAHVYENGVCTSCNKPDPDNIQTDDDNAGIF